MSGDITVAEAARRLGVRPRTVLRRIRSGAFPNAKLGTSNRADYRIPFSDLVAHVYGTKATDQ